MISIISPVIWEVVGGQFIWVSIFYAKFSFTFHYLPCYRQGHWWPNTKQNLLSIFSISLFIGEVVGDQLQCKIVCHCPILWKWLVTYHHKDINNITNITLSVRGVKMMSEFVCVYSRITYMDSWPWGLLKIKYWYGSAVGVWKTPLPILIFPQHENHSHSYNVYSQYNNYTHSNIIQLFVTHGHSYIGLNKE